MNPQTDLTATKLHRILFVLALVVCVLVAPESGRAQAVAIATLTNNGSSTVNITGNQSFNLTLMINTNFISGGLTYFLAVSNNGSGLFQITAVSPPPVGPPFLPCLLDPVCDSDLGPGNLPNPAPPGNYTVGILTLQALNAPVGQYTIFTDRGIITDRTGGAFNDVNFAALATINVVPEPTSVGLALVGGAALLVIVRRRKRPQVEDEVRKD